MTIEPGDITKWFTAAFGCLGFLFLLAVVIGLIAGIFDEIKKNRTP